MNINSKIDNIFFESIYKVLVNNNLISKDENIKIEKTHPIKLNCNTFYHYIITPEKEKRKYLVRTTKEKDYSYSIRDYLVNLNTALGYNHFSNALLPPFKIAGETYIITSFIEGSDLESQIPRLDDIELHEISIKLHNILNELHSVTSDRYSSFDYSECKSFAEIMFNKIKKQCNNTHNVFIKNVSISKLLDSVYKILSNSSFTDPTLLHMDITPRNIIYTQDKKICLIDFELSRFGDIDYEWTNMLIKVLHTRNERFKQNVLVPIINNNFMPLEKALYFNKYKVYLLYLSINKYIYNVNCELASPLQLTELIDYLIYQLTDKT